MIEKYIDVQYGKTPGLSIQKTVGYLKDSFEYGNQCFNEKLSNIPKWFICKAIEKAISPFCGNGPFQIHFK